MFLLSFIIIIVNDISSSAINSSTINYIHTPSMIFRILSMSTELKPMNLFDNELI